MSLTSCTGRASHTEDAKPWITRAAMRPSKLDTCEQARRPPQYYKHNFVRVVPFIADEAGFESNVPQRASPTSPAGDQTCGMRAREAETRIRTRGSHS